ARGRRRARRRGGAGMEGGRPGHPSSLRRRDRRQQPDRQGRRGSDRRVHRRGREAPDRGLRRPGARVLMAEADALIADLQRERDALFAMLDAVEPGSMTTPGLLGEWSGRELIAHLGYWTGHATEVIHLLEVGRITEDDLGGQTV